MAKTTQDSSAVKELVYNRRARFDYHILESYEAGMVLTGGEIKSIRAGEVAIAESYIAPVRGELFLLNAHIKPYKFSSNGDYDPLRPRKLLMHRHEIDKLIVEVQKKGLTIVPIRLYLKQGKAKLEIGLARGKAAPDKREAIKEKETKREMARAMRRK